MQRTGPVSRILRAIPGRQRFAASLRKRVAGSKSLATVLAWSASNLEHENFNMKTVAGDTSSTDKATNRRSSAISAKVLDWLAEEQYRRWKETSKAPTRSDLIREAIEISQHPERLAFTSSEDNGLHLSEETCKYIQLLISMLESEPTDTIRAIQQSLRKIYDAQQAAVLESALQRSRLQAAATIARFLRSGAVLHWGQQGWEVQKAGALLTSETVEQLMELGFIGRSSELERHVEHPSDFVHDLLSNQGMEPLDKVSRRAFRANQSRAYFEYLSELLALYQDHSILCEGAVSYPALVREKMKLGYHFAWLYLAGVLHLLGITEQLRIRFAESSLAALGSPIG